MSTASVLDAPFPALPLSGNVRPGKTHVISVFDLDAEMPRGHVFIEVTGDVALSELRSLLPSSWDISKTEGKGTAT